MRIAGRSLERDDVFRMAAALTYRTIFSLIPTLVLSLIVLGWFWDAKEAKSQLQRVVEFLNLEQIQVQGSSDAGEHPEAPWMDGPAASDGWTVLSAGMEFSLYSGADGTVGTADDFLTASGGGRLFHVYPGPDGVYGRRPVDPSGGSAEAGASEAAVDDIWRPVQQRAAVSGWIDTVITRIESLNFAAIGYAGVLILLYAALSLVVEVERCFNQIYGTERARSWVLRIPQYWLVLTIGPTLVFAGFYIGEQFQTKVTSIASGGESGGQAAVGVIGHVVTIAISWLLLFLMYRFVPNTRVRIGSALIGSFLAAVTWEVGKVLFREYLQSPAVVTLYGSLALLPLFLLWVYVTWGVVLFGLKVSYLQQHFAGWAEDALSEEKSTRLVGPAIVVSVMGEIASGFAAGRLTSLDDLTGRLGLDPELGRLLLRTLDEQGLVRLAADGSDEDRDGWVLARPAESVPLHWLVRIGQDLVFEGRKSAESPATAMTERLRAAALEATSGSTLADLVAGAAGGQKSVGTGSDVESDEGVGAGQPG